MAYIFEEQNFKEHLRNNATSDWFSTYSDNARYETPSGTRDVYLYAGKPTVRVQGILKDPGTMKTGEKVAEGVGHGTAVAGGILAGILAPFSGGMSVLAGAGAVAEEVGAHAASEGKTTPEDVYFTIAGNNSKWVAQQVDIYGIKQVAENIYRWSNDEVYQEKFSTQAQQIQP